MATTADIKNGLTMKFNNGLYTVVSFLHVKPGKGPAFVRTKLKNVQTGKVIDNTFSSGHKIETVRIERRQYQYLYKDDIGYHFMNMENFEQIPLPEDILENVDLLKEGLEVDVLFHAEEDLPLYIELPAFVELEITYTEPGVRGDTSSTSSLKPATVETGAEIMVPLFVNTGEKIKVDTRDRSYSERVK